MTQPLRDMTSERTGETRPPHGLFAVPPGVAFADGFAAGFWARYGTLEPMEIGRITVYLNTARALRETERALAARAAGPAILPRLALIEAIGANPTVPPGLPPAVPTLSRHLSLLRLVERYLEADAETGREAGPPISAAAEMAESLAALMDELNEEGVAAGALDGAASPEHAAHWHRMLGFLDLVRRAWPEIRAERHGGALDAVARRGVAIDALIAAWRADPPRHPVIAAGSTGSVASTARLLAAIAELPTGAVVLPALDTATAPEIWREIAAGAAPEHPQAPFARLLGGRTGGPAGIPRWDGTAQPGATASLAALAAPAARATLIAEALRPPPVTDAWHDALPRLGTLAAEATAGLTLVEAENPRAEAACIALAIRRAIAEPGRRAALVTPDGELARRVTAELQRFGIVPDDSLGRPLSASPAGIFLRLIAGLAAAGPDPVRLAALLSHPLCQPGLPRSAHRALAHRYERRVLRTRGGIGRHGADLPTWPDPPDGATPWRARIGAAIAVLAAPLAAGAPLQALADAHRQAAEALSQPDTETPPAVWQGADGQAADALMSALAREADAHGEAPVADYPALLLSLLKGEETRPRPSEPHPRVAILGTREARNHAAETVILGGLNEGTWPALPGAEPWLNRPMRADLGLPAPEARIGLSAHDFVSAIMRPEAILTRARKVEGTPTVPSRWLLRITSLLGGVGGGAALAGMQARGEALIGLLAHTHAAEIQVPRASRPAPTPPVAAQPRTLSVTEIETLVRDPYAIYAKHVLGLVPLDPLGLPPDMRDRGIVIHKIVQRFVEATKAAWPGPIDARATLERAIDGVLAEDVPWPKLRRVWRARLLRAADWFLNGEDERRRAGAPLVTEARGQITFPVGGLDFTLTARADRIDARGPDAAAIFDYKTGAPPSIPQIKSGFNLQLHLQAHILAHGGFAGLPALEAKDGAYIGLTGARDSGGTVRKVDDLGAEAPDYFAKLVALLRGFQDGQPYLSRAKVEKLDDVGDYDHLARYGEWEAGA